MTDGTSPTSRDRRREASARRILDAAREEFGEHGLEAATVRGIARRAGVDPSLVLQHYGSKGALFSAAIDLGTETPGDGPDGLDGHVERVLAARLDEPPAQTRALVRSMLTAPEATEVMKRFLDDRARNLARAAVGPHDATDPDDDLRAALAVTAILGLVVGRHFLRLDALVDVTDEQVERVVRPWISSALDAGRTRAGG